MWATLCASINHLTLPHKQLNRFIAFAQLEHGNTLHSELTFSNTLPSISL